MDNNPRTRWERELVNPFAGLLFCHSCGRSMHYQKFSHCNPRITCKTKGCGGLVMSEMVNSIVYALEMEELPNLEAKLNNNEGRSATIQKKLLDKLNRELDELMVMEETQYEMLENKTYTPEIFAKRNKALHIKIEALKAKIYEARQSIPKEVNYEDKIIKLHDAIAALRDESISADAKNKLLKAIVARIEYEKIERIAKGNVRYKLHILLNI
jgi:hypothetical protein